MNRSSTSDRLVEPVVRTFTPEAALKLLRSTMLQIWDHPEISERHRGTLLADILKNRRELTKVE